jgi:hypothetical protein
MEPLHHHLIKVDLHDLKPTQVTVGFAEVNEKREQWYALEKRERQRLIQSHWFPSVIGPGGHHYIVDHHHLGLALHQEGQKTAQLTILKSFSKLDEDTFWRMMEFHQWVHPFDSKGQRVPFSKIPLALRDLKDDPFRSLAGIVREQGGFAKDLSPFSEFLWADHFRKRLAKKEVLRFSEAVISQAFEIARATNANYLPGWVGNSNP